MSPSFLLLSQLPHLTQWLIAALRVVQIKEQGSEKVEHLEQDDRARDGLKEV